MSGVIYKPRFRNKPILYQASPVGPIGEAQQRVKLKHSSPDLPQRYDDTFSTGRVGQNIQDGDHESYLTGGGNPYTFISDFERPLNNTTGGGWTQQELIPTDRLVIPETTSLPSYSWENLKGETYKAKITGDQFLPLPGGYKADPSQTPRGGAFPLSYGGGGGGGPEITGETVDPSANAQYYLDGNEGTDPSKPKNKNFGKG